MRGIDEDEVHYSHSRIDTKDNKKWSISKEHEPLRRLEHYVKMHRRFYIHPPNGRENAPEDLVVGIKPPPTSVLAIFLPLGWFYATWGWFYPPFWGCGFIPS